MHKITLAVFSEDPSAADRALSPFLRCPLIGRAVVVHRGACRISGPGCTELRADSFTSARTLAGILEMADTPYLLLVRPEREVLPGPFAMERMVDAAEATGAGMVYADYYDREKGGKDGLLREHPVNDYQPGSLRDDFDFGPLMLFSVAAIRRALKKHGPLVNAGSAGLYDLRLKVSTERPLFHLPEFLATQAAVGRMGKGERHFDYQDPRNRSVQRAMERAATRHLRRIGAWLPPTFSKAPPAATPFPVEASVIIPVRDRRRTVAEAVASALSQKTDFPFNVIVVDNHSTDGTTPLLSRLVRKDARLVHLIPSRRDLHIGGCWNEAIFSPSCGRYAVQLDSDDLYSGRDTLRKIVDRFRGGDYGMVIGSYTLVNERLDEIEPGLIDHREWTDANGHNNALRVNGLGAPRAFQTELLRSARFPNVGYGEDYAVALRLSREYRIGRIYESLYLCRRWRGNTDASLGVEQANRNDAYKDRLRSLEILARQKLNRQRLSRQKRCARDPETEHARSD